MTAIKGDKRPQYYELSNIKPNKATGRHTRLKKIIQSHTGHKIILAIHSV